MTYHECPFCGCLIHAPWSLAHARWCPSWPTDPRTQQLEDEDGD